MSEKRRSRKSGSGNGGE